jgi:hypothetical protein
MDIAQELDDLRRAHPACALAAFGDISARMILCASGRQRHPQEQLDQLCAMAVDLLRGESATRIAAATGRTGRDRMRLAITLDRDGVGVFLGAGAVAPDLLCCLFDDVGAVDSALSPMLRLLDLAHAAG